MPAGSLSGRCRNSGRTTNGQHPVTFGVIYSLERTPVHTRNMTKLLRVSERTHEGFKEGFKREAERRGETIDSVATAALRALRQKDMGRELAQPLGDDEQSWLGTRLGVTSPPSTSASR